MTDNRYKELAQLGTGRYCPLKIDDVVMTEHDEETDLPFSLVPGVVLEEKGNLVVVPDMANNILSQGRLNLVFKSEAEFYRYVLETGYFQHVVMNPNGGDSLCLLLQETEKWLSRPTGPLFTGWDEPVISDGIVGQHTLAMLESIAEDEDEWEEGWEDEDDVTSDDLPVVESRSNLSVATVVLSLSLSRLVIDVCFRLYGFARISGQDESRLRMLIDPLVKLLDLQPSLSSTIEDGETAVAIEAAKRKAATKAATGKKLSKRPQSTRPKKKAIKSPEQVADYMLDEYTLFYPVMLSLPGCVDEVLRRLPTELNPRVAYQTGQRVDILIDAHELFKLSNETTEESPARLSAEERYDRFLQITRSRGITRQDLAALALRLISFKATHHE